METISIDALVLNSQLVYYILIFVFQNVQLKEKDILSKYDEEIDGEKRKTFELGSGGKYANDEDRNMDLIRQQLRQQSVSCIIIFSVI